MKSNKYNVSAIVFYSVILALALFLTNMTLPASGLADIWYVDGSIASSGDGTTWATAKKTIQEGIDVASNEDEIWIKEGTYPLTTQIQIDKSLALYGGFDGTESQIEARDLDNHVTIVDGQNTTRCFYITENQTIDGLTVTNGYVVNGNGGGLFVNSENITISNCTVQYNQADFTNIYPVEGGGIYTNGTHVVIIKSNILYNSLPSSGNGGGIKVSGGSASFVNCNISNNYIWNPPPETGGAGIYASGCTMLEITETTISNNSSYWDFGGLYACCGKVLLTNSTFLSNNPPAEREALGSPPKGGV